MTHGRVFALAFAAAALLAATLPASADDNVKIMLGTFHDQRQAYVFAVNPFGAR